MTPKAAKTLLGCPHYTRYSIGKYVISHSYVEQSQGTDRTDEAGGLYKIVVQRCSAALSLRRSLGKLTSLLMARTAAIGKYFGVYQYRRLVPKRRRLRLRGASGERE